VQTVNTIQPTTTPSALAGGSSPTAQTAQASKTQFLQLLVAQLKGQNPLDPKDGAEFVSQLAQFSSLEELINIRTSLDALLKATTTPTTTATATTSPFDQK
jgi:flagellar basal-body rod modification protein FlgD